jgi:hypothetical protein
MAGAHGTDAASKLAISIRLFKGLLICMPPQDAGSAILPPAKDAGNMLKLQESYFLTNKSELRADGELGRLEQHRQSISVMV